MRNDTQSECHMCTFILGSWEDRGRYSGLGPHAFWYQKYFAFFLALLEGLERVQVP